MWLPNQFGSRPAFDTPMNPPVGLPHVLPATICLTVRAGSLDLHVEVERLLPHRHQKHRVASLPEVFLGDLQLDGLVGLFERAEQRRGGLPDLEIDWPVLDLDDDVVVELPVEALEIVVGGPRAIVLQVAPVHPMVVDEARGSRTRRRAA